MLRLLAIERLSFLPNIDKIGMSICRLKCYFPTNCLFLWHCLFKIKKSWQVGYMSLRQCLVILFICFIHFQG